MDKSSEKKLQEAKEYIWSLPDSVRAQLAPFILGRFDVQGKPVRPRDPWE